MSPRIFIPPTLCRHGRPTNETCEECLVDAGTRLVDVVPVRRTHRRALELRRIGAHVPTVTTVRGAWKIACSCGWQTGRIHDDHDAERAWFEHAS